MSESELKAATPYVQFDSGGSPYLQGTRCTACGAVFIGTRENCASCAELGKMSVVTLGTKGKLYNYTIVHRSFPGVKVPFIAAVVDLQGGGTLKGNLLDVEPNPAVIEYDMPVDVVFRGADIATAAGAGYISHFFVPAKKGSAA
jgi:uncharacterized OB-fold protein